MGAISEPGYVSTRELATERFNNAQSYSNSAFATATDFLGHLSDLADESYGVGDCEFNEQDLSIDQGNLVRPETPEISMVIPATPTAPITSDVIVGTIESIPAFDVPDPSIIFPSTPTVDEPENIGNIPSISDFESPVKPTYDIPSVPTFSTVPLPSVPDLNLPAFEGVMPIDDLVTPTNTFNFQEDMYGSDLLTAVRTKLASDIASGGTGLGATVENAIWLREQERAELAAAEAKEQIAADWENRGFNLPDGVVTAAMLDVDLKLAADRATSSRDIAVKQAELALTNQHFTIQQGIVLEGQLMGYASQMAQRSLEAQKAVIEMAVAIFNAEVAKYGAKLDGYKAQAVVYESRIRASLATAELYKAQIEGAKLVSEQNLVLVELYKAQLSGIDSLIKLYVAEMEAGKVQAETDRTKIEAFKAQVEAFTAKVQINVAKFNMYEAAIRGEGVKAQVYATRVSAYESRVKAASTEAQVVLETAKIESEIQKTRIETYGAEIEAFKSMVQAEGIRVNSLVDIYKGETDAYKADATVMGIVIDGQVKAFQSRIEQSVAEMNACLKKAEISLSAYTSRMALRAEVTKAGAMVSAQLAASALSGVQASAALSAGEDTRISDNTSYEYGDKTIRSYNYTA
jgi:hypothetical protein